MTALRAHRGAPCSGARELLRNATAGTHMRMHRLWPFRAIAGGRLGPAGYARLLRSLFLFHSAIAVAAQRHGWGAVSSSAKRLELLVSDLDCLGSAVPPAIPDWRSLGAESTLGAVYVAEGSVLGGRLVARQLDYMFGAQEAGRRFFLGRPECDSRHWRHVVSIVDEALAGEAARDEGVRGALSAFCLFEACVVRPESLLRPGQDESR